MAEKKNNAGLFHMVLVFILAYSSGVHLLLENWVLAISTPILGIWFAQMSLKAARESSAKFCSSCGTDLEAPANEEGFCSSCGTEVQPDTPFCGQCGTKQ
jgi:hypothetical protein